MKTGGSFLGQYFASNLNIFYIFEPLHVYDPHKDRSIDTQRINASEFLCINQSVACRMDYLFSCHIKRFFQGATFAHPEKSKSIYTWKRNIFADSERRYHTNAMEVNLDSICRESHEAIAIKTIRIDKIVDVLPLIQRGIKVDLLYFVNSDKASLWTKYNIRFICMIFALVVFETKIIKVCLLKQNKTYLP